jgi:MSHA biogenesis protein MshO
MMKHPGSRFQRGFTLVEAVMVIVIIGLLGGIVAVFIQAPMQAYADSVARAELSDVADLALRRMARDIRLALPNSIRVNGAQNSLEFLVTRTGGQYLAAEDGAGALPVLDFIDPTKLSMTVVGAIPGPNQLTPNSDYLVVSNLGAGFTPANAWDLASAQRNITMVTSVNGPLLGLADNPFAAQAPQIPSPDHRFHIVSGPVTYYCGLEPDGITRLLTRQSGYGITAAQVTDPVPASGAVPGKRGLLAGSVKNCLFEYKTLATQRSALVVLTIELQPRNSTDASITLVHQVHVDNSP